MLLTSEDNRNHLSEDFLVQFVNIPFTLNNYFKAPSPMVKWVELNSKWADFEHLSTFFTHSALITE